MTVEESRKNLAIEATERERCGASKREVAVQASGRLKKRKEKAERKKIHYGIHECSCGAI